LLFEVRFDGFGHGRVAFPAFVLQFEVLDCDRGGVRIEVGQDLIIGCYDTLKGVVTISYFFSRKKRAVSAAELV